MHKPAKLKIDIKGKQIVCGGDTIDVFGESLVLIGEIISSDEKKVVLEGTITEIDGKKTPCWIYKSCPKEIREGCPAFPHAGYACMAIMKTMCKGSMQDKMTIKLASCNKCDFVFGGNHSIPAKNRMQFDKKGQRIKN